MSSNTGEQLDQDVDGVEESPDDRIDRLEQRIESVAETQQAVRETSIKPRLESLQSARDDAREERAELKRTVDELEQTVAQLQAELNAIVGVDDSSQTSPQKRQRDLRAHLIDRAKDRDGRAAMYYKEIQEFFEHSGHGKLSPPVCLDDMRKAQADQPGFRLTEKRSRDGNQVEAIEVVLDDLPGDTPVREPKNRSAGSPVSGGDRRG